jgi:hypothetical protein
VQSFSELLLAMTSLLSSLIQWFSGSVSLLYCISQIYSQFSKALLLQVCRDCCSWSPGQCAPLSSPAVTPTTPQGFREDLLRECDNIRPGRSVSSYAPAPLTVYLSNSGAKTSFRPLHSTFERSERVMLPSRYGMSLVRQSLLT